MPSKQKIDYEEHPEGWFLWARDQGYFPKKPEILDVDEQEFLELEPIQLQPRRMGRHKMHLYRFPVRVSLEEGGEEYWYQDVIGRGLIFTPTGRKNPKLKGIYFEGQFPSINWDHQKFVFNTTDADIIQDYKRDWRRGRGMRRGRTKTL